MSIDRESLSAGTTPAPSAHVLGRRIRSESEWFIGMVGNTIVGHWDLLDEGSGERP